MDKPICRLCGKRHLVSEFHVYEEDESDEGERIVKAPVGKVKFDRVAYQREYMRKRRMKDLLD